MRSVVGQIADSLGKIESESVEVREGLEEAMRICEGVVGREQPEVNNMTASMRMAPRIESLILSSQNSLSQFG